MTLRDDGWEPTEQQLSIWRCAAAGITILPDGSFGRAVDVGLVADAVESVPYSCGLLAATASSDFRLCMRYTAWTLARNSEVTRRMASMSIGCVDSSALDKAKEGIPYIATRLYAVGRAMGDGGMLATYELLRHAGDDVDAERLTNLCDAVLSFAHRTMRDIDAWELQD